VSIAGDILASYPAPGQVLRRRLAAGRREPRALAVLMGACALIFVGQWPRLARDAAFDPAIGLDARLAGAFFAWILLAPLIFYLLALLSLGLLRLFGRGTAGFETRMALFWALLAAAPVFLAAGLVTGFTGAGPLATAVGALALLAFLWIWLGGLSAVAGRKGTAE